MALSPDTSEFVRAVTFPKNTGEVMEGLRRGDTVIVEFGSTVDMYLSEMDTDLPLGGEIIYQLGTPDELQDIELEAPTVIQ